MKQMKRFVVFGGDIFYAFGGFADYAGSFGSRQEAIDFARESLSYESEWWQVFDMAERVLVEEHQEAFGSIGAKKTLEEAAQDE